MALFWIIAGVLFIVVMGLKEGEYMPFAVVFWLVVLGVLASLEIPTLGIMICVGAITAVIWFITKTLQEDLNKFANLTPEELKVEFEKEGYHLVDEDLEQISKSPNSPLKKGGTITECYLWYCEYKTMELNFLHGKQLDKYLGVPFDELPLDENTPPGKNILKAEKLAVMHILEKRGLRYIGFMREPLPSYVLDNIKYTIMFNKFIDTYDFQKGMKLRKKELEVLAEADPEEFERLLGYKLPKYEYPFSDESVKKRRIEVAIYEILHNEGYMNVQDEVNIQVYGKWQDRKIACDRGYELYTMKHSEFEKVYGSKLSKEQLKNRTDVIEIIAMREGWKYNISENNPIAFKVNYDDIYEMLKDDPP